ncbi:MAG TPA: type II secretion system F family protein [Acidothermales bacterium]
MTASAASGALLGLTLAGGLILIWSQLPIRRRPTLDARLAPYVGELSAETARLRFVQDARTVTPFPTLERLLRPHLASAADLLERILGGGTSIRRRLDQSGSTMSLHEFRIEQLVWAAVAFAGAVGVSLLLAGGRSPMLLLVFCAASAVGGIVARDHRLTKAVRDREQRMLAEFPTIADLLALSVAAGEGPVGALDRVARVGHGELVRELRRALSDARTGTGFVQALDRVAERTSLAALARFVDGVAVAVERGTPLADVLRAQAADVREARKRSLLEIGGRKEIAMMVPVIFLVLPITVLFALYPGLVQISSVVP